MKVRWATVAALIAHTSIGSGCYSGGAPLEGLAPANPEDTGPRIVWDLEAEPLPEIPFPNDVGTRPDGATLTGRRVNVSLEGATTRHERRLRTFIDRLDGWGTFSSMWLQFEERLDLERLHSVQNDADPRNDAIYLVNVDRDSPRFGQRIPLELGSGPTDWGKTRFPIGLTDPGKYFTNDPRSGTSNILLETVDEDTNGDGILQWTEDTDDDGVLDVPNLWGEVLGDGYARLEPFVEQLAPLGVRQTKSAPCGRFYPDLTPGDDTDCTREQVRQYFDMITFYELETDTLMFRPIVPLDQSTTYAVVLTRRIVGAQTGSPIRSPFVWVNHLQQTEALRPLVEDGILTELGLGLDDLAFTWTFTTQSITLDLEALRAGIYGEGPFARLASVFPPELSAVHAVEKEGFADNVYTLEASRLFEALDDPTFLSAVGIDSETTGSFFDAYRAYVQSFVFASFDAAVLIEPVDGVFEMDAVGGDLEYDHETVYLMCAIPKERGGHVQPFPVMFYGHGYTSAKPELLGFAGSMARFGIATCSIDAFGHGLPDSDLITGIVKTLLDDVNLEKLGEVVFYGRAKDLNRDGVTDSGGDFWGANIFHTRDVVRQSLFDYMQAIRIMRSFGRTTMPVDVDGDGDDEIGGDFDGDGVPDIGGEQPYYGFGQSLGGILFGALPPLEPSIVAAVPGSGAGGFLDVGVRATQGGVVQAVFLPMMGPIIVGMPSQSVQGRIDIAYDILDVNEEKHLRIASVPDPLLLEPAVESFEVGDRVRVINLDNGEMDEVRIREPKNGEPIGLFRARLPADLFDRVRIEIFRDGATSPYRVIDTFEREIERFQGTTYRPGEPLMLLQEGFGFRRQSPELRRLFAFAQMGIDAADPINYAPLFAEPVEVRPEGRVPTNVLVINTVGDMNVPVNTGIAFSRAAGHFSLTEADPRYGRTVDDVLLDTWVIEGLEDLRRFAIDPCHHTTNNVLFDVDDTSRGVDPEQGPTLVEVVQHPDCDGSPTQPDFCAPQCQAMPALRATVEHPWGVSGMRIPYVSPRGAHGFETPDDTEPFDYNTFQINQIGWFFATEGHELLDEPCMADSTEPCPFF